MQLSLKNTLRIIICALCLATATHAEAITIGRVSIVGNANVGILPGSNGTNLAYSATIGFRYNMDHNFYAGARIGYTGTSHYDSNHNKSTASLLTLPLEAGWAWSSVIAVNPYVGLDFNYGLGGHYRYTYVNEVVTSSMKDRLGMGARVGIRLRMAGIVLAAAYVMPINANQKCFFGNKAYPEFGLGFAF